MRNQAGYQDNSGDVGKYDPTRAAQLLDEAGWKLDGNVRKKDGKPLEITLRDSGGVATSRQESELMQNMLGQIGVKLTINTVPIADFFDKYITPGPVRLHGLLVDRHAVSRSARRSRSTRSRPMDAKGELDIQQNYARVGSDEIDRLYDQATQELDREKAIELANRIDALIWQEVHSLTLYQRPELWVVQDGLANIGAFGFAELVYEDIGWANP